MYQTVTALYFSPTGNTRKSVEAMAKAITPQIQSVDLTALKPVEPHTFSAQDLVIFGAPVYGGRIPAVARQRFLNFQGQGTPCLVAVTYGNRDFDDALLELAELTASQGFVVKGAAALVGRHTYGEIQTQRPDEADLQMDQAFARKAIENDEGKTISIPGNHPYKDGGAGGSFRPLTSEKCVKCGLCVKQCPVGAIGEDCKTIQECCIACVRCIRNCPTGAKNMKEPNYQAFAVSFTQRLQQRKENQYFL